MKKSFCIILLLTLLACDNDSSDEVVTDKGIICGGLLPNLCPNGEFCKFEAFTCGAADQTGICTEPPQICTQIYAPVCGCDGQTYASTCTADAAQVSIQAQGECPS